jgi:hypothetical protein
MGHSQTGRLPIEAALVNPASVKGMILVEPGGCRADAWTDEEIAALAPIPTLVVFGDHLEADTRLPAMNWQSVYEDCQALIERVNARNGNAEMLYPPELGIHGNTHLIMMGVHRGRERRAPVLEHRIEPAVRDQRRDVIVGHAAEADAVDGRSRDQVGVVADELPLDSDDERPPVLFELPGVEAAERLQPQLDAGMRGQVVRLSRPAGPREIGRRARHQHPLVRADADRDHVALEALAEPDAGVEALLDDVDELLLHRDLDLDVGMVGHQPGELRIKDVARRVAVRADPDRPGGTGAQRGQTFEACLDLVQRRPQGGGELLAGVRRRDAAGGAGQQAQVEPLLEPLDRVAERRLGRP